MERRSNEHFIKLEVYTDGACKKVNLAAGHGDKTFGGWAYCITRDGELIGLDNGGESPSTNQRMELMAAIEALKAAEKVRQHEEKVILYSDSAYLVNCFYQNWWRAWQVNGWMNSKKQPVANAELWAQLIPYFSSPWYDFQKVKGHNGVVFNELCDTKASEYAQHLKEGWLVYGESKLIR